jgi:hypothetical protein
MADFFKGLAGGMQTGLQFGQAIRKRRMDDELAQVYAKPETSQGYIPEQMAEMRRQQETGAYDIQGIPGAEGQPPTLRYTPRQDLDLQGDVPAAPTDFAPQQVQRYGGQTVAGQFDPAQLRGLQMREAAGVLGRYGDVRGAAALEAQAEDFTTKAAEREYQARMRPLEEKAAGLRNRLTESQLTQAESQTARTTALDEARQVSTKIINDRIAKTGATQLGPDDYSAAEQAQIQFLQTKGYGDEADKIVSTRNARIRDQITTESTQAQQAISAAISSNNLDMLGKAYDRFVHDGAKVVKVREGEDGKIYIDRVLDNGGEVEPVVFKNRQELFAAAENLTKPGTLLAYSQTQFDNNLRSAAAETQKTQFAEKLKISKAELELSTKRYNISAEQLNLARKEAERKTLGGQIKELEGALGVKLSDADKKSLGGIKDTDPLLKAELEVITGIAKSDGANPKTLETLPGQIQSAMARSQARSQDKDIISTLRKAQQAGNGLAALQELSKTPGMTEAQLQNAATQAGIPYTAPAQPAQPAQPARSAGGGLTTGAQPAPYVPPAGSPAAIAAANRAKGLETNAETQRIALAAQQRLADQFASDARTLSPVELSRKYDAMRGQLPVATRAELQQIERNIR